MNWTTERKIIVGFTAMLLVLLLITVTSILSMYRARADSDLVDHTHEVLENINRLDDGTIRLANEARAYVNKRNANAPDTDVVVARCEKQRDIVNDLFATLKHKAGDNPLHQARLANVRQLLDERCRFSAAVCPHGANRGDLEIPGNASDSRSADEDGRPATEAAQGA